MNRLFKLSIVFFIIINQLISLKSVAQGMDTCDFDLYIDWDTYFFEYYLDGNKNLDLTVDKNVQIGMRRKLFYDGFLKENFLEQNQPLKVLELGTASNNSVQIICSILLILQDSTFEIFQCYPTYFESGKIFLAKEKSEFVFELLNQPKEFKSVEGFSLIFSQFENCKFSMKEIQLPDEIFKILMYSNYNLKYHSYSEHIGN